MRIEGLSIKSTPPALIDKNMPSRKKKQGNLFYLTVSILTAKIDEKKCFCFKILNRICMKFGWTNDKIGIGIEEKNTYKQTKISTNGNQIT